MTFEDFARVKGLLIRNLHASDKIQRCPTEKKPRSTNGAYYWDGRKGWCMSWDDGNQLEWFESDTPWTEREKLDWEAKRTAARMERMKGYALAEKNAAAMLSICELGESPYLKFKGLGHIKAHVNDEVTMIPMRNHLTNKLVGLQKIWWNPDTRSYDKKFLPGMRAKGAVTRIGRGSEQWFCEGWATGLSLSEALKTLRIDHSVVVTFSAANLVYVAKDKSGFVFADNDMSFVGEDAARATGLPWTMSEEIGWDANDVHQKAGIVCLMKLIQSVRALGRENWISPMLNRTATIASIGQVKKDGGNIVGSESDLPNSLASESANTMSKGRTGLAHWSANF